MVLPGKKYKFTRMLETKYLLCSVRPPTPTTD
jgi:hypothetical protein